MVSQFHHHLLYLQDCYVSIPAHIQAILKFPFPKNIAWRAPPVPSIFVPYDMTRDFFFSGHTGLAILLTMEVERFRLPKWLLYLSYWMIAWMPLMLISTRIHYTIDVLSSPFYLLFTKDICRAMGACPDYSWSLPHLAYTKVKQALCTNSK